MFPSLTMAGSEVEFQWEDAWLDRMDYHNKYCIRRWGGGGREGESSIKKSVEPFYNHNKLEQHAPAAVACYLKLSRMLS